MSLSLEYLKSLEPRYTKQGYSVPKWIIFCKELIKNGWEVSLYRSKSTVSKYVFIKKDDKKYKVRFSNHKANRQKEDTGDCNFYVGVGNKGVITTEQLLEWIINGNEEHYQIVRRKDPFADEQLELF